MIAISILALVQNTIAFSPSVPSKHGMALRSVDLEDDTINDLMEMVGLDEVAETEVASKPRGKVVMSDARVEVPDGLAYDDGQRDTAAADWDFSLAIPFMEAPKYRSFDVKMAGDAGFDPFSFADRPATLKKMRDAELKHGRLAMLAATGWPIAELYDKKLSGVFGLEPKLVGDGLSPSILNGGLGSISPLYWAFCLGAAAAVEWIGIQKRTSDFPGDFGFDPLNLNSERMADCEIRHSRLAMIAIVAYAFQEAASGVPVVKETPFLFENVFTFANEWANAGYVTPQ
jgi:hypothetical protein